MIRQIAYTTLLTLSFTIAHAGLFSFLFGSPKDGPPKQSVNIATIKKLTPIYLPHPAYGNPKKYTVGHHVYYPLRSAKNYKRDGIASWYGTEFQGDLTSDGKRYNLYAMTAANKTLPIPTFVRVTNLNNGKSVIVKVNDRGPFIKGRLIDLSYAAAFKLGVVSHGTAWVEVAALTPNKYQAKFYTLQVATYFNHHHALYELNHFNTLTNCSVYLKNLTLHNKPVYSLFIGPFYSRHDLKKVMQTLKKHGIKKPLLSTTWERHHGKITTTHRRNLRAARTTVTTHS